MSLFVSLLAVAPWKAGLMSLAVPGWGQFASGQTGAGWGFLAAEAVSGLTYGGFTLSGNGYTSRYQAHAFDYAGADPSRRDEPYWSALEYHYNTDSYIQELYAEARREYPDDPAAQQAYVDAKKDLYGQWQWEDSTKLTTYQELRSTGRSRFAVARAALGVLAANHLFAGLEAFVYARFFKDAPDLSVRPTYDGRAWGARVAWGF